MKTAVVFGGAGFIGTAVVDRLLSDGCILRVFEWALQFLVAGRWPIA
jgi:nucleoside-diphosphate-sugar epimerase